MTGVFEGVGTLQFTPDNKHAYGFSGSIGVNATEETLLEFKTNSEYLDAIILFSYVQAVTENFFYKIYFNDILVQGYITTDSAIYTSPDNLIPIIIPPFTNVKLRAINSTDNNIRQQLVSIKAKVKGAIEQENLEAITNNNKWASK